MSESDCIQLCKSIGTRLRDLTPAVRGWIAQPVTHFSRTSEYSISIVRVATYLSVIDELDDALEVPVGHVQEEDGVLPRTDILK